MVQVCFIMGLKNMVNKRMVDSLGGEMQNATKEMADNMKVLYEHIVQVEKNQLEFEQYLKQIIDNQKQLDEKIKN